ncbi:MAG: hypothetical protein ACYDBV_14040, partial [Nitrospiria bacterium]
MIQRFFGMGLLWLWVMLIPILIPLPASGQEVSRETDSASPPPASGLKNWVDEKILPNFTYSGIIRQETALRIYSPVVFTKVMSYLRIEAHYSFSPSFQLTVVPRAYYDAASDLEQVDYLSRIIGPRTVLTENPSVQTIAGTNVGNLRGVDLENKVAEIREIYL